MLKQWLQQQRRKTSVREAGGEEGGDELRISKFSTDGAQWVVERREEGRRQGEGRRKGKKKKG